MEDEQSIRSSFRRTLRQYSCFRHSTHEPLQSEDDDTPKLKKSPEIKYKCRHLISQIGRQNWRHSSPADFRYDPISYALNFDDGCVDEVQFRNIASRVTVAGEGGRRKQSVPLAIYCA